MNKLANLAPFQGSIRKNAEVISTVKSSNSLQGNFREALDAIKVVDRSQTVEYHEEKTLTNVEQENLLDDSAIESIEKALYEIETYLRDGANSPEFEDVLNALPLELVNQIMTFVSTIKYDESQLNLDKVTSSSELIGLLLIIKTYVENNPSQQKKGLLNLIETLKVKYSDMVSKEPPSVMHTTNIRYQKFIHELMENIENILTKSEKPISELQSRIHYLHTVHARYFSTPKGIEKPQTIITNIQEQNVSTITQNQRLTNETIPLNEAGSNLVSKAQQFSIFVEQSNTPLPNQQQFIRQFQNILARSSFLNNGGQQKLLINLYPEHLGSLRIELLQTESGMIARIMASTSQAKELLESQLANLRHTFIAQNISVDKIEVSTQLQYQTERNMQRENEHQQEQRQQSDRQQDEQSKQEHGGDETSFTSTLLNELVNFKV